MRIPADIHTHILPCMDDGSKSPEQSAAMLREEARQGISLVALTPHFYASDNSPAEFLRRREKSWQMLLPYLEEGMPQLMLGAEVQYFEGIASVSDISSLCIGQSGYLLLEMPFMKWTERMLQELFALDSRGDVKVILAHVDRYFDTQPGKIWSELYNEDIRMQLNAEAFLHFRTSHRAKRLMRTGAVRFLGSDCHNMKERRPNLECIQTVVQHYGNQLCSF